MTSDPGPPRYERFNSPRFEKLFLTGIGLIVLAVIICALLGIGK